MIKLDAIRKQAHEDLQITCPQGHARAMLWEHALRVCDCARLMTRLPELRNHVVSQDILTITALYHDVGWAVQFREGELRLDELMGCVSSPIQRTLGATYMLEQLQGLADKKTLEASAECIRVLSDHDIEDLHAQIVAEADHLDEFSVLTACTNVARELIGGKSIEAVLATWDNQKRYGYWVKKIKDSFRFESIRNVAKARLTLLEEHINHIRNHHHNLDLQALLE